MRAVLVYGIIFGTPLLLYGLWLKSLRGKLGFLLLLPVIVCAVWLALWPANYLPAWESSTRAAVDDSADGIVTGFLLLGWLYGIIGCLPVIMIEAIRSFLQWGAARRGSAGAASETKGT